MKYFYGEGKKSSYFEGWYFKQTCEMGNIAFIPAFHVNKKGNPSASLQILSDQEGFNIKYPIEDFYARKNKFLVKIDQNQFSDKGCKLDIKMRDLQIKGELVYKDVIPPKYDIMGPFKYVPFMECRHKVVSLQHQVSGQILFNGKKYKFEGGPGYIEGDRGTSFPQGYFWTQCTLDDVSLMVSIAEIPFLGKAFMGSVGFVYMNGTEYRLATYLGVRLLCVEKNKIHLKQGELQLEIFLIEENPKALSAPQEGDMGRTIHESPSCTVRYRIKIEDRVVLDTISKTASFEWDFWFE